MSHVKSIFDFPYQLRQSKKAKRMNINISPEKGVEVVYPLRASKKGAIRFLQQQQAWVMKHFSTVHKTQQDPKSLFSGMITSC